MLVWADQLISILITYAGLNISRMSSFSSSTPAIIHPIHDAGWCKHQQPSVLLMHDAEQLQPSQHLCITSSVMPTGLDTLLNYMFLDSLADKIWHPYMYLCVPYHCTTVPLCHCTTVPLYHCTIHLYLPPTFLPTLVTTPTFLPPTFLPSTTIPPLPHDAERYKHSIYVHNNANPVEKYNNANMLRSWNHIVIPNVLIVRFGWNLI